MKLVTNKSFIDLKNLEINNKNIKRLRYKTWNNNLNELTAVGFKGSTVLKGINFINNGDGSWTIKGKKTETGSAEYGFLAGSHDFPVSNGDKVLFTKMAEDALNSKYSMYPSTKNSSHVWIDNFGEEIINKDVIYTMNNASAAYVGMSFVVRTNDYVDIIVAPQAYNLTKIYGAGKEPTTVEQFYKDYPLAKTSPLGFSDLGIIPSNSGYILNKYDNLSEELLEENIEKDTVNYHIPDKTNILLNKVEGKTNKIVQLLDESTVNCSSVNDWTGGTGSDTNLRVANGVVSIDGTLGSYSGVHTQFNTSIIKGHKYYISIWAMCSKNAPHVLFPYAYGFSSSTSTLTANEWENVEKIDTANISEETSLGVRYGAGESSEETATWSAKKPQILDLTAMYGFGNEPTTIEQFKKDYPQFFDQKLDGIWNVRTSSISTTGKNLFDMPNMNNYYIANGTLVEKSDEYIICQGEPGVEPGESNYSSGWFEATRDYETYLKAGTYTISADWICLENEYEIKKVSMFIDISKLSIRTQFAEQTFYTGNVVGKTNHFSLTKYFPEDYYQIIFTLNSGKVKISNIQIELNSTDTSYEPYQENKIDLLRTQELNGINGINDYIEVIDKGNGLYDLKKTQNIVSVNMGSLGFDADGNNFVTGAISPYIKPPVNDNSVGNYICQKYVNCTISKSFVDGDFGVNSSGYVYFRNSAYTTAAAFQTAMSGTILYYQLKTPVTTTIATNLTYDQVSAVRTNGGLLLVNDNNNQKYAQPNVTIKSNYQYKS